MDPLLKSVLAFALLTFSSVFFLVDPFAVVPTFLAMTGTVGSERRRSMAQRAAFTCAAILILFAIAGSFIFRIFGITLPAFKIAGGLILLQIGIDMLQARRSGTNEAPGEAAEGAAKEDASIIP